MRGGSEKVALTTLLTPIEATKAARGGRKAGVCSSCFAVTRKLGAFGSSPACECKGSAKACNRRIQHMNMSMCRRDPRGTSGIRVLS